MNSKTLVSGGVCVAVAAAFAISAITELKVGSATNMGPGYFPLLLSAVLAALGLALVVVAFSEERQALGFDILNVPWRGMALLGAAPVVLGYTVHGLGMGPSVFISAAIASFASRTQTLRQALIVSFGLALSCVVIFGLILKLPIPIVGPWLGR